MTIIFCCGCCLSCLSQAPSQNEVGKIINVSRAKIGGNNFKKKTYAI